MVPSLFTGSRGLRPNFPPTFVSRSRKSGRILISQSPRLVEASNWPLHQRLFTSVNKAAAVRLGRSIIRSGTRPERCRAHKTKSAMLSLLPTVESSSRPRSTIAPPRMKMFHAVFQSSDPPVKVAPASTVVRFW